MEDKILIKNLEVFSRHGVMEEERVLGQKFLVSMELGADLSEAGADDDLSKTIDYGGVCHFVSDFMTQNTFYLIETAAIKLVRGLLIEYEGILKEVKLTIEKPWAPIGLPLDGCSVCVKRGWHRAFIGAGSNMGDRMGYLNSGVEAFEKDEACRVVKKSDVIETKPYGGVEQDDFLNMVFEIKTFLTPTELLSLCNKTETKADRKREVRWGPRTLDLDILLYDDLVLDMREPYLCIPHVDMLNRRFVMEPLNQIAPGFLHPVEGKRIGQLFNAVKEIPASKP